MEDNAICGISRLSIIGFVYVIEKLIGGLFALKDKYVSGCKISANKRNWITIISRFVTIFKTMCVLFGIILVLQLSSQSLLVKWASITISWNVSCFGVKGTLGGRM
jgi:hypothetical protein